MHNQILSVLEVYALDPQQAASLTDTLLRRVSALPSPSDSELQIIAEKIKNIMLADSDWSDHGGS